MGQASAAAIITEREWQLSSCCENVTFQTLQLGEVHHQLIDGKVTVLLSIRHKQLPQVKKHGSTHPMVLFWESESKRTPSKSEHYLTIMSFKINHIASEGLKYSISIYFILFMEVIMYCITVWKSLATACFYYMQKNSVKILDNISFQIH